MTTTDIFDGGLIRYDDQSPADYFTDAICYKEAPILSASAAQTFYNHSPAKAYHDATSDGLAADYQKNLTIGTVAHSVILRQEGWEDDIAVLPEYQDWRTKAARIWRDTQMAQGKHPILQKDMENIHAMREAWEKKKLLRLLSCDGKSETSLYWRCRTTGCLCKVRWDFLPPDNYLEHKYPAIDYKTTGELVDWVRKNVANQSLMLRAALYYESLVELTGHACNIAYAVQEKTAPYTVQVHLLALHEDGANPAHVEFIEAGREQLKAVKEAWRDCHQTNKWAERREMVAFDCPAGIIKTQKDKPIAAASTEEFLQTGGAL